MWSAPWHHERVTGPHIAVVSWGFPPFRGSGAFRPLAVANALAKVGARVTVIAADREVFLIHYGADTSLEQRIDARIAMRYVPFYPENAWPVINDWGPERAGDSSDHAKKRNRIVPAFPEKVYDTWLPRIDDALRQLHHDDPVDLIWSTGSPYGDLEAAVNVGSDDAIPVVLDDRDSFLADVFTGGEHKLFAARRPFAERWFRCASQMWFVNPPIADWHRDRFPQFADRFQVVENGWDPGTVDPSLIRATPGDRLRVGYVGLVPTNFPMDVVLGAWQRVHAELTHPAELLFIGPLGYATGSPAWQAAAAQIAATNGVSWHGHLSRTEIASAYADLDVLLLAKEGGVMVTGGKTYEYGATGLPIAGIVDPQSDAVRVLAGYPRFHLTSAMTIDAAADTLRAAISDSRSGDSTDLSAAQKFGASLSREAALGPALEQVMQLAAS